MRYVTSFSPSGYDLYGKRFLETFIEHHKDVIWVYVEDKLDFRHPQVVVKDLLKVHGCAEFLAQCGFPMMRGHPWGEKKYNYRYDVFRFCRKSFAQVDAAATNGGDWLIWIDADVELGGPLPKPTGHKFMHYLGRPDWHSCASYVAWNLKHPLSGEFFKRYWSLYITGTVFALPEWHDSYVLDQLRTSMDPPSVNLAEEIPAEQLQGPANVFDLVFPGNHHKKGNLKWASA